MGVPLNHPFLDGMFPYKPSSYGGTPIYGTPHFIVLGTTDDIYNVRSQVNVINVPSASMDSKMITGYTIFMLQHRST